jgi:thiamine-phosphate pyrophosphorylase
MTPQRNGSEAQRQRPRLYIMAGSSDDVPALAQALASASRADIAAVLLRLPAEAPSRDLMAAAKTLAPAVQSAGAAFLLDSHADLVVPAGADGTHLANPADLQSALALLKPDRIVGVGGLTTRHDAMTAAEAGADYMMFGEPDPDGHRPAFSAVLERITWWSEIFQPPCVGFAADLEELTALAHAGADFVALGDFVWNHAVGPAAAMSEAAERLGALELV